MPGHFTSSLLSRFGIVGRFEYYAPDELTFAEVRGDGRVTREAADYTLRRLEIDALGLDAGDRRMLNTMVQRFDAAPWASKRRP